LKIRIFCGKFLMTRYNLQSSWKKESAWSNWM
jgi:hypothetical protein